MNTRLMQLIYKESIAAGATPKTAWQIAFRIQRQEMRGELIQAL